MLKSASIGPRAENSDGPPAGSSDARPRAASPIARHARSAILAMVACALGLYLVGNGRLPLWDRDEPRYAQCSRQMLQSGDWVVPWFLNNWRTEKPPLIYWCQATAMRLIGSDGDAGAFAARLPSTVAMIVVLAGVGVLLLRTVGPRRAVWTVFILATSGLSIMSAKMALTDATLLVWVTTAQVCLYAIYRGNRSWGTTIVLWVAVGLAGLTKGPIVLATLGFTLVVLAAFDWSIAYPVTYAGGLRQRASFWARRIATFLWYGTGRSAKTWWGKTRPLVGLLIITAIVAPWIYLVDHRTPGFLKKLFGAAARHATASGEKHVGPPGFYLAFIWGLFFP